MNKKVYMSVRNMPNKLHLTDAKGCMFSKLTVPGININTICNFIKC